MEPPGLGRFNHLNSPPPALIEACLPPREKEISWERKIYLGELMRTGFLRPIYWFVLTRILQSGCYNLKYRNIGAINQLNYVTCMSIKLCWIIVYKNSKRFHQRVTVIEKQFFLVIFIWNKNIHMICRKCIFVLGAFL